MVTLDFYALDLEVVNNDQRKARLQEIIGAQHVPRGVAQFRDRSGDFFTRGLFLSRCDQDTRRNLDRCGLGSRSDRANIPRCGIRSCLSRLL